MPLADPAMMLMKLGVFRVDLTLVKDKAVADATITSIEDIENFIWFFTLFFHLSTPYYYLADSQGTTFRYSDDGCASPSLSGRRGPPAALLLLHNALR